jgi:hypothetical protein
MRAAALLLAWAAASAGTPAALGSTSGCDAPANAAGCACGWGRDETGPDTFRGLAHPPDFTPAEVLATGLPAAVLKAADQSASACELVCCQAKLITDAPAAEQAPPQTGPCGTWQFLAPPAGTGCWVGLDPIKRPLPKAPTAGEVWVGGAINQGAGSDWGLAVIITLLVSAVLYLGGGLAFNVKSKGMAPGLGALPHRERWTELGGLVIIRTFLHFSTRKMLNFIPGCCNFNRNFRNDCLDRWWTGRCSPARSRSRSSRAGRCQRRARIAAVRKRAWCRRMQTRVRATGQRKRWPLRLHQPPPPPPPLLPQSPPPPLLTTLRAATTTIS